MKIAHLAFAVASFSISCAGAFADTKKPVSNWSCQEFLAVDEQYQPKVIYWATAKTKTGKPETFVDIEGAEKVVPIVVDDCKKTPGDSFVKKLKNAWRAVEAEAKKIKEKL